jgi:hypothetical protein
MKDKFRRLKTEKTARTKTAAEGLDHTKRLNLSCLKQLRATLPRITYPLDYHKRRGTEHQAIPTNQSHKTIQCEIPEKQNTGLGTFSIRDISVRPSIFAEDRLCDHNNAFMFAAVSALPHTTFPVSTLFVNLFEVRDLSYSLKMNSCDDKKAEILFTTESIQPTQFLDSGAC